MTVLNYDLSEAIDYIKDEMTYVIDKFENGDCKNFKLTRHQAKAELSDLIEVEGIEVRGTLNIFFTPVEKPTKVYENGHIDYEIDDYDIECEIEGLSVKIDGWQTTPEDTAKIYNAICEVVLR